MQSASGATRKIPLGRLALYVTLSFLDLVLTGVVLRYSNGRIYESNPIAGAWLEDYGWRGLVTFKVLMLLLVSLVSIFVSTRNPRAGTRLLTFACLVVGLVVLYSWYLLMRVVPP
jgi:hypothetical protein